MAAKERNRLPCRVENMEAKQDVVEAAISIYVHNTKELDNLIAKLNQLKEIQKVVRKNSN